MAILQVGVSGPTVGPTVGPPLSPVKDSSNYFTLLCGAIKSQLQSLMIHAHITDGVITTALFLTLSVKKLTAISHANNQSTWKFDQMGMYDVDGIDRLAYIELPRHSNSISPYITYCLSVL